MKKVVLILLLFVGVVSAQEVTPFTNVLPTDFTGKPMHPLFYFDNSDSTWHFWNPTNDTTVALLGAISSQGDSVWIKDSTKAYGYVAKRNDAGTAMVADGKWSPLSVDGSGNLQINIESIRNTAVDVGEGNVSPGTQRFTLASDDSIMAYILTKIDLLFTQGVNRNLFLAAIDSTLDTVKNNQTNGNQLFKPYKDYVYEEGEFDDAKDTLNYQFANDYYKVYVEFTNSNASADTVAIEIASPTLGGFSATTFGLKNVVTQLVEGNNAVIIIPATTSYKFEILDLRVGEVRIRTLSTKARAANLVAGLVGVN